MTALVPTEHGEIAESYWRARVLLRGPRIVARGAVDDKGQVMGFLEACRATLAQGDGLPVALTVLLEGEEEC
ncbi:MAG: M20/M25/M40 family metallo-hydrolase, partial [Acetobacteraceae bacterium]